MGIFDDIINGKQPDLTSFQESGKEASVITEATYLSDMPYIKIVPRKIFLPRGEQRGRGNLCFLYTNSVDESIKQMNSTSNFISAHQYYFYYYNPIYQGVLYNKRYGTEIWKNEKQFTNELKRKPNYIHTEI